MYATKPPTWRARELLTACMHAWIYDLRYCLSISSLFSNVQGEERWGRENRKERIEEIKKRKGENRILALPRAANMTLVYHRAWRCDVM